MPEHESERPETPDLTTIRQLVRLMHRFDLTAIDLSNAKTTIRLRRHSGEHVASNTPDRATTASLITGPTQSPSTPPSSAAPVKEALYIRSPMVGTFYESPAPDAKPYVAVGSSVGHDTTVCLIEAMKVFTEINAGMSGTILELMVKNGQPVEFDQPLFRVEPT